MFNLHDVHASIKKDRDVHCNVSVCVCDIHVYVCVCVCVCVSVCGIPKCVYARPYIIAAIS